MVWLTTTYWGSNISDHVLKNSIARHPRPAVSYLQTECDNVIICMVKNLLLKSINRGYAIRLYRKKLVILYTELFHREQYTITYSTVTSHNRQPIKICHFARNLASCELLPCSDRDVDRVIMERSSWECLADLSCCGRGCYVLCDFCRTSLWFSRGFRSRSPCCLAVSFLLSVIVRQPLPL